MSYPWYDDKDFITKLLNKKEFIDFREDKCLKNYQKLASNYINPKSPYNSLLLYMSTGTGKTLASIAIAENFINFSDYKIIVITKNKDLIYNFKKELLLVCSNYTTTEEINAFHKASSIEQSNMIKKWLPRVNKYSFKTYSDVKSEYSSKELKNFNNSLVIIDEVHNILGNERFQVIFDLFKKSFKYKLVVLSATPVFDKTKDLCELNNLLNIPRKNLQIDEEKMKDLFINIEKNEESMFKDNTSVFFLSRQGREFFTNSLKGKVILIKPILKNYPKIIEEGERIGDLKIKVIPCYIKPNSIQQRGYEKIFKNRNVQKDFFTDLQYAMDMIYPSILQNNRLLTVIGKAGYDFYLQDNNSKNITKTVKGIKEIFGKEYIENYSAKLYKLLQNITVSRGKICIYCHDVEYSGIVLIRKLLDTNDIKNYYVITSKTTEELRKNIILKFNNVDNDDGSKLKILIFSDVLSEGITFKSVRELHIVTPIWNFSSVDQVVGRVARNDSHKTLKPEDRNVKIFKYCCLVSDSTDELYKSIDYGKYLKGQRKDKSIKEVERIMMKSSFLCNFNIDNNVEYFKQFEDNSRECQYKECIYKCDEPFIKTNKDLSTYETSTHDFESYKKLKKIIYDSLETKNYVIINSSDPDILSVTKRLLKQDPSLYIKDDKIYRTYSKPKEKESVKVQKFSNFIKIDKDQRIFANQKSRGKICSSFTKEEILNFLKSINPNLSPTIQKKTKAELCYLLVNMYYSNLKPN